MKEQCKGMLPERWYWSEGWNKLESRRCSNRAWRESDEFCYAHDPAKKITKAQPRPRKFKIPMLQLQDLTFTEQAQLYLFFLRNPEMFV